MTPQKVAMVVRQYQNQLIQQGYAQDKLALQKRCITPRQGLNHVLGMCDQVLGFIEEGRTEKAMRWLGFMQGVLWLTGKYTLAELKAHNKPDKTQP